MKNLFDPVLVEETVARIRGLRPESRALWGSMGIKKMLAHTTAVMEMATGARPMKRAPLPLYVIGRLVLPLVVRNDRPIRRNSPSAPELFPADAEVLSFEVEREKLVAAVEEFAGRGPEGQFARVHPFFGPMNAREWAVLMYKHVDHHLRQFGG